MSDFWGRPIKDSLNLLLMHLNSILNDDMPQAQYLCHTKLTFGLAFPLFRACPHHQTRPRCNGSPLSRDIGGFIQWLKHNFFLRSSFLVASSNDGFLGGGLSLGNVGDFGCEWLREDEDDVDDNAMLRALLIASDRVDGLNPFTQPFSGSASPSIKSTTHLLSKTSVTKTKFLKFYNELIYRSSLS